jgi:NTE family protein
LILGDPLRYNATFMIDNGYHFGFGIQSSLHQFHRNVSYPLFFDEVQNPTFNQMDINYSRFSNGFFFLTMLSTNFNMTTGARLTKYSVFTTVFSAADDERKFYLNRDYYTSVYLDLYYDDLDDFYFPSHGVMIAFNGHYISHVSTALFEGGFYNIRFDLLGARRHPGAWSTSYELSAGIVTHLHPPLPFLYFFGGIEQKNPIENIIPFFSRDYLEIKASSYLMLSPQIQKRVKSHYFQLGAQILALEKKTAVRFQEVDPFYNLYFRYGLKSYFGPVFVTYAYEPQTGKNRLNFSIGFLF